MDSLPGGVQHMNSEDDAGLDDSHYYKNRSGRRVVIPTRAELFGNLYDEGNPGPSKRAKQTIKSRMNTIADITPSTWRVSTEDRGKDIDPVEVIIIDDSDDSDSDGVSTEDRGKDIDPVEVIIINDSDDSDSDDTPGSTRAQRKQPKECETPPKHDTIPQKSIPATRRKDGAEYLASAKVHHQPPDGNCLFHSLAYGLKNTDAKTLRIELANFLYQNPETKVAGTPLREWIAMEGSTKGVLEYCHKLLSGVWGGAVEMQACSLARRVNIYVYEEENGLNTFKRISSFESTGATQSIHLLYSGVHYDFLEV